MAVVLEKLKEETYPLVKWVGGKRQLMFELLKNMPENYNRYFEPFIGGGALFFELQPQNGYISDMNEELINLYSVVRDDVYELIEDLGKHEVSKEYFLEIRNIDRTEKYAELSSIERASRFIYLNRTCFNGMYRVNSQGQFNVPFGNYKNPRIVDDENLINCSKLLKNTEIYCADFSEILNKELIFTGFTVNKSKVKNCDKYITIQFKEDENSPLRVAFTASTVLIDQFIAYENQLPFIATIKKVNRYMTLT